MFSSPAADRDGAPGIPLVVGDQEVDLTMLVSRHSNLQPGSYKADALEKNGGIEDIGGAE